MRTVLSSSSNFYSFNANLKDILSLFICSSIFISQPSFTYLALTLELAQNRLHFFLIEFSPSFKFHFNEFLVRIYCPSSCVFHVHNRKLKISKWIWKLNVSSIIIIFLIKMLLIGKNQFYGVHWNYEVPTNLTHEMKHFLMISYNQITTKFWRLIQVG